jgi:hypothetical protein
MDGVGKKFCRSLKKSLWYGVCDIASELNPFGRVERMPASYKYLTTELTEDTEGRSGSNQRADSAEFLEGHSQACLQMDSQKSAAIRNPNESRSSEEQTILVEKSAEKMRAFGRGSSGQLKMSASNSARGN